MSKHKTYRFTAHESILLKSFPSALRKKLGDEKVKKLCGNSNYRRRRHKIPKCSRCGSTNVRFRVNDRTFKCLNPGCGNITPAKSRIAEVGNIMSFHFQNVNRESHEYMIYDADCNSWPTSLNRKSDR